MHMFNLNSTICNRQFYVLIIFFCLTVSCSRDNKIVERYEDGKIKTVYYQVNAENHGSYKSYFRNGFKEIEGNFIEGKKNGKFIYFDSTGVKRKEAYYQNDLMHGTIYDYYPKGQFAGISNFEKGIRNGEGITYYKNGDVRFKTYFENGERIFFNEYDSINGDLIRWWMDVEITHERDSLKNHKILFKLENKKFDYVGVDFQVNSGVFAKEGEYAWGVEEQSETSNIEVTFAPDELGSQVYIEGHVLDLEGQLSKSSELAVRNSYYFEGLIQIISSDSSIVTIKSPEKEEGG